MHWRRTLQGLPPWRYALGPVSYPDTLPHTEQNFLAALQVEGPAEAVR